MNVKGVVWKLLWILALLPVLCSATEYDAVKFSLENTDIQAIAEHDGSMWIQLSPPAASRLQTITAQSYGKQLIVDIDGISVFSARIYSTIESGVIQVDNPSPDVRRRLERLRSLR
ncbi:MAG: hypothetical protein WC965_13810 [Thiohalomonadaceae bacterium]